MGCTESQAGACCREERLVTVPLHRWISSSFAHHPAVNTTSWVVPLLRPCPSPKAFCQNRTCWLEHAHRAAGTDVGRHPSTASPESIRLMTPLLQDSGRVVGGECTGGATPRSDGESNALAWRCRPSSPQSFDLHSLGVHQGHARTRPAMSSPA